MPVSNTEAASFLMAASFGPTTETIDEVAQDGYSHWVQEQLTLPMVSVLEQATPEFEEYAPTSSRQDKVTLEAWYENAVLGEDQLRQRAAFALSQIFVVSTNNIYGRKGHMHARFMDILQENAFGNFRDLLQDVTYSPSMGVWLTYIGNKKADPETGSSPDENYARELMQLFTIGLFELNSDGTVKLGPDEQPISTYTSQDVEELAKVFTGLWWGSLEFGENATRVAWPEVDVLPMDMHDDQHSPLAKTFLNETIPASYSGNEAISATLDILFNHPNVGPFICKQLIQRFTTSNPSPAYVSRVVDAFETGSFTMPNGASVGFGNRGDLAAVWAAILLDEEAIDPDVEFDPTYGKIREPIIRFIHWARFANINRVEVDHDGRLIGEAPIRTLGQSPFRSPSVFNFYRPDYMAPMSETGKEGLVSPELQITHATTMIKYANFMRGFVMQQPGTFSSGVEKGFTGGYEAEIALAEDPAALADHLNLVLTAGRMSEQTLQLIRDTISSVEIKASDPDKWLRNRVQLAVQLAVSSREYLVQQ